ncbi:hypothetical protein BJ912DRAFT_995938 [Pholiota molesta]|nr:hypothetical protein BJ912DRAFT_995938 [Pholiota molesta]
MCLHELLKDDARPLYYLFPLEWVQNGLKLRIFVSPDSCKRIRLRCDKEKVAMFLDMLVSDSSVKKAPLVQVFSKRSYVVYLRRGTREGRGDLCHRALRLDGPLCDWKLTPPVRAVRSVLSHILSKFHLLPWRPIHPSPLKFAPQKRCRRLFRWSSPAGLSAATLGEAPLAREGRSARDGFSFGNSAVSWTRASAGRCVYRGCSPIG